MLLTIKWLVVVVTVALATSEARQIPNRLPINRFNSFTTRKPYRDSCNSTLCQQDAKEILESLDKSVDPCDDFYMFSCGGWMEKHPATKDTPYLSHYFPVFPHVMAQVKLTLEEPITEDDISPLKGAKKMYQVCMDNDTIERAGIQPLVDIINEFEGWPMAMKDWNVEDFSLETALAEYDRRLFRSPFFHTKVGFYADIFRVYIHIEGPKIGLTRSELLDPWEEETREEYKHIIANVSLEILNALNVNIKPESVLLHATEIVEFMIQLQNISLELSENWENMSLQELQEWTDSSLGVNASSPFNWLTYLNKILSHTDIVLDEHEEILVHHKEYLFKLFMLLDSTPQRIVANYLHWRIIDSLKGATTKRMQELTLYSKNETRPTYCSRKIFERFNHVLNSRMVPNLFNEIIEYFFGVLVESIRLEFKTQIANIEWLDDEERGNLTDELRALKVYGGYPKEIYNNASALMELYKQVNVSDEHFNNMLTITPYYHMHSLLRLRDSLNLKEEMWLKMGPENAIAVFVYRENAVYFTFGLVQPHFFNYDRLKSLNYGRIGNTVGHEIMHKISFSYMEHDWRNVTSDNVDAKHQCFIDQYNNYHIPELEELTDRNVTLNGTTTLIENLADVTGVYTAYKAWQTEMKNRQLEPSLPGLEEYSPDQMFFIGYGTAECESRTRDSMEVHLTDSHAPMSARVRGTVSNLEDFATAFNCPPGSNMNPVNKCRVS